ncbi:MAG: hypothetical protein LBP76_09995 [Treponema sp.]|jgi:Zn-dependent M32 family carboxypeptidase|nr:hypothetical protein [Treponema sp.]
MDLGTTLIAITSVLGLFVGLPSAILLFVYKITKNAKEKDKLKYQKEILELEIEKQRNQIKLLEEENKKYDAIIDNHNREAEI